MVRGREREQWEQGEQEKGRETRCAEPPLSFETLTTDRHAGTHATSGSVYITRQPLERAKNGHEHTDMSTRRPWLLLITSTRNPAASVHPAPVTCRPPSTSPVREPNAPKKTATSTRKWVPATCMSSSSPPTRNPAASVHPAPVACRPPSTSPIREPNAPKKRPRAPQNG
jgi:hypothetical protein